MNLFRLRLLTLIPLVFLLFGGETTLLPAAETSDAAQTPTPKQVRKPAPSGKVQKPAPKRGSLTRAARRARAKAAAATAAQAAKPAAAQTAKPTAATPSQMETIAPGTVASAPAESGKAEPVSAQWETATFGGGCFWCVEGCFLLVPGVKKVVSGYAGGRTANPTYAEVTKGDTGHAEVVQVTYDATKVTYEELVDLFWESHDPTQLNRQGSDVGPQYRSIIFVRDETQRRIAEQSKAGAQRELRSPIVTEIVPLQKFYVAEDFHQQYAKRHPGAPYCKFVVKPKLEKFKKVLDE